MIDGEVIETISVRGEKQGIQITGIDLIGPSKTKQYTENGTYKLVRVDDD